MISGRPCKARGRGARAAPWVSSCASLATSGCAVRAPRKQPFFPGRDASEEFEGSPDGCTPPGSLAPCPPPVLACQDEPIRPGPSGFSDPGGNCIEARFVSRPGGGISPVSQWRLTCLTGLTVSPPLRCHAGCCPHALGYRTSPGPPHARTCSIYARWRDPGKVVRVSYSGFCVVG